MVRVALEQSYSFPNLGVGTTERPLHGNVWLAIKSIAKFDPIFSQYIASFGLNIPRGYNKLCDGFVGNVSSSIDMKID